MNSRILRPDELGRVSTLLPNMRPEHVDMAVVEDHGEIVATMGVYYPAWYESVWISEWRRGNPGVIRSLLKTAATAAEARGRTVALAMSNREETESYLRRLGGSQLDGKFVIFKVGGGVCPQQ